MTATIIAEALAAAERETPHIGYPQIFCILFDSGNVDWTDDVPDSLTSGVGDEETCVHVRSDFLLAALKHLAERLERAEARIAALRGVAGRHVCDYVSQWGVSDDGCACVVCQVHDALVWDVAKEAKP